LLVLAVEIVLVVSVCALVVVFATIQFSLFDVQATVDDFGVGVLTAGGESVLRIQTQIHDSER